MIGPVCPSDACTERRKEEKCTSYRELKYEILRIWKMRKVEVTAVVIGALRTVKNKQTNKNKKQKKPH